METLLTEDSIVLKFSNANAFEPKSMYCLKIDESKNIDAVFGVQNGKTQTELHTLIFNGKWAWTESQAIEWYESHKKEIPVYDIEAPGIKKALSWLEKTTKSALDYKTFNEALEVKDCEYCDDGGIKVSGFLSTFKNTDRENDIVHDSAFDETVRELKKIGKLPMLRDHRSDTANQIGSFTKFEIIPGKGLYVEGKISKTPETEHIIKLIQDGHLNTFSMGGLFKYFKNGQRDSKNRAIIEAVNLLEGSVVVVPANPKAIFELKSFSTEQRENAEGVDSSKPKPLSRREKMIKTLNLIIRRQDYGI